MTRPTYADPMTYPEALVRRLERDAADAMRQNGIAFSSCFPKIEALLSCSSEYQRALWDVADKEAMGTYRDRVEFLFAELFPEQADALAAHRAGGRRLNELMTPEEAARYEHVMFCVMLIAVAVRMHADEPDAVPVSWRVVKACAHQLADQSSAIATPRPTPQ